VCIAALTVFVGLLVVSPKVRSFVRVKFNRATCWANKQVSPETKIEALRLRLQDLAREDDRHFDLVARQTLELEKRQTELKKMRANLQQEEGRLRTMKTALDGAEAEKVSYNGGQYDRDDFRGQLREDFLSFKTAEDSVKAKERGFRALEKTVAANRQKLRELQRTRAEMQTRLDTLEAQLAEERRNNARPAAALDDVNYSQLNKDIDELADELRRIQIDRELRGQPGRSPIKATDAEKSRQQQTDREIEARLSRPAAPVASGR